MKKIYKINLIVLIISLVSYSAIAQYGGGNSGGWAAQRAGTAGGPAGAIIVSLSPPGSPILLPVELLSFDARLSGDVVNVYWQTASEINNDFFTVERSGDGINFSAVKNVKGSGNSSITISYEDVDYAPLKGISYYRLKQTDFDGKFSYSKSVAITISSPGSVIVSRNASSGNYLIDFKASADVASDYTVEFTNSLGQVIYRETLNAFVGSYNRDFDFISQGKGIYLISITSSTDKIIKRVVAY